MLFRCLVVSDLAKSNEDAVCVVVSVKHFELSRFLPVAER